MTKELAIQAMEEGRKVTHPHYPEKYGIAYKYLYMKGDWIINSSGAAMFTYDKGFRHIDPVFDDGWNIYTEPQEDEIESILRNVVKYCEDKAIYDKLGNYGDFYYNIKKLLL